MRATLASIGTRRGSAVLVTVLVVTGLMTSCGLGPGPSGLAPRPPEPTPAVVTQVRIDDLARDAAPPTDYLSAAQIHTASGETIPLRIDGYTADTHGSTQYVFSLLGLTSRGYVVQRAPGGYNDTGVTEVYLVTASSTSLLDRSPSRDTRYTLSSDGTRLVRVIYTEDCSTFTVLDLDDTTLASMYCRTEDSPNVLAVTRSAVWYAEGSYGDPENGVFRWNYAQGGGRTKLSNDWGWYAAPDHDQLFVSPESGGIGPTSLRAPAEEAWRADLAPAALSPDTSEVLGASPARHQTGDPVALQVRRVDDGTLVASFDFPGNAWFTDAWWQGEDTVLVAVSFPTTPNAGRLVRCRLSGSCDLVGTLVTGSYSHMPAFAWQLS